MSFVRRGGRGRDRGGGRRGGFRGRSRGGRGGFRGGRERGGGRGFRGGRGRGRRGGGREFRGGRGRGGFRGGRGRGGFREKRSYGGGKFDRREREPFKNGGKFNKFGGRGGGRNKVYVEKHRHPGVFVVKGGKDDMLATINQVNGESVYGEKRICPDKNNKSITNPIEYRVWNPFRSKLAATILGGVENIYIGPGDKVLYIGAASGTTVSHCSDIVGPKGIVYAVEFSARCGRDLIEMAKKRTNVIPILDDARKPWNYRMLIGMVDCIFSDCAQPDQSRILALNAKYFLKNGGHAVIAIKSNCVDSTQKPEVVFASEREKLEKFGFTPEEQCTLEPYERAHASLVLEWGADDDDESSEEEEEEEEEEEKEKEEKKE